MKVLVINAGSSSLKYQLIDMTNESVLAKGNCERIGTDGAFIGFKTPDGQKIERKTEMKNHTQAFLAVKDALLDAEYGAIKELSEVTAIGHRVVQGGSFFDRSVLIDENVIEKIKELSPLAPLHNPAHIQGIDACTEVFGKDIPQVAVFDTAFHQTMPEKAYMYAIPYEYYEKYGVRKYGFHGTSHRYVSARMAELLGKPIEETKIITCHIGNGSSITAVNGGKVIFEQLGAEESPVIYDTKVGPHTVHAESRVYHNGNLAVININGKDYAVNSRGLNIVIYDKTKRKPIDSVCFDTHISDFTCFR